MVADEQLTERAWADESQQVEAAEAAMEALRRRVAQSEAERDASVALVQRTVAKSAQLVEDVAVEIGRMMGMTTAGLRARAPRWVAREVGELVHQSDQFELRRDRHTTRMALPPPRVPEFLDYYRLENVTIEEAGAHFGVSKHVARGVLLTYGATIYRGRGRPSDERPTPPVDEGGELELAPDESIHSAKIRVGQKAARAGWRVHWDTPRERVDGGALLRFHVTLGRPAATGKPRAAAPRDAAGRSGAGVSSGKRSKTDALPAEKLGKEALLASDVYADDLVEE
jgi:hypothetical protein